MIHEAFCGELLPPLQDGVVNMQVLSLTGAKDVSEHSPAVAVQAVLGEQASEQLTGLASKAGGLHVDHMVEGRPGHE